MSVVVDGEKIWVKRSIGICPLLGKEIDDLCGGIRPIRQRRGFDEPIIEDED